MYMYIIEDEVFIKFSFTLISISCQLMYITFQRKDMSAWSSCKLLLEDLPTGLHVPFFMQLTVLLAPV